MVPELVVFNTTGTPLSLTLTLRDPAGQTLTTPAGTIDVPGFNTALVSLGSKLATAAAGKPYIGRFSAQISGAAPFGETTSVVHVTQYYGKAGKNFSRPVKPASAFVVRALFVTGP